MSKRTDRLLKELAEEEAEEARLKAMAEEEVAKHEEELARQAAVPKITNHPAPAQFDAMAFADAVGIAVARTIPEIIKAIQQSNVDPDKERIAKIKEHRKQQMREDQRRAHTADVDKWLSCSHMRTHPYTGTSRVGWAQQSDGYVRGVCMGCGCPFTPIETELPDPVRMKGMYERMRAIPMSITHNDFTSGMVVAGNPA
jgi:hypothetical protein